MRRPRLSALLALAGAAATLAGTAACPARRAPPNVRLGVYEEHVTLETDATASPLTTFDRAASPRLMYRVTLTGAPVGERLDLSCSWVDPGGRVAHENAWRTLPVRTSVWPTHCRCTLGAAAETGMWKVEMLYAGRVVSTSSFEVK